MKIIHVVDNFHERIFWPPMPAPTCPTSQLSYANKVSRATMLSEAIVAQTRLLRGFIVDAEKKTRLEAKGFKVGSAAHVLGMTPEEEKVAQVKAALREAFRAARKKRGLTQTEVASRLGTKKEAVARMESSGSAVTIDNLMRALLVVGVSLAEVAFTISNVELEPAAAKRQGARDSIRLKVEHSNGTASEIAGSVVRGTRVMDLTDIDVLPTPAATVKARAVAETASRLKSAPTAGRDIRKTPKSPRTVI